MYETCTLFTWTFTEVSSTFCDSHLLHEALMTDRLTQSEGLKAF